MTVADGASRSRPETIGITRVDPAAEESDGPRIRAWSAVVAASMARELPGMVPPAADRFHACLTTGPALAWTATAGDRVVGLGVLRLSGTAATGRAQVHVHPDHRLRGVGERVVAALVAEARARGLRGVLVAVPVGGSGDAVCRRRGLLPLRTLHHLLLSLRDLHPGWLDEMAAAEHPGYRLTEAPGSPRPTATVPSRGTCC